MARGPMHYIDLRIMSRDTGDLGQFLQLCGMMEKCGRWGASRDFNVSVDGDGSADIRFQVLNNVQEGVDTDELKPADFDIDNPPRIHIGE